GSSWEERRRALSGNPKPRILLIGHLRGIATISGLHVFVDEVLPELTAVLGPEGFDVEVVGAHDPPASLRPALDAHPAVHLLVHDENVLLADTPGLARETLRAIREPELRERLGRRGRELYEAEFTPERAGTTIVQELERLAERR